MKHAVEERGDGGRKAVEGRRGRRYKEGDQMILRRGFFLESSREIFYRRTESKKGWNREGRKLEEGVNSRGQICT